MNDYIERRRTARLSGWLFLLWIVLGFYDMFFVSPKIFVSGDSVASAQNILKYEFLFRTSIFSGLLTSTLWVLLVWVFYGLFRNVNERYAKLLVASVVVQVPVAFVKAGLSIATVMTLKGDILKSFELAQRQDLAMAFLKINDYSVLALELFWGFWLFPLAILIYQSVFIPRFLGIWLVINGIVYVLLSFTSIVLPEHKDIVFNVGMPAMFGELVLMLWLLIKGTRDKGITSA
ncbi:MAG: DUF4386 domain-containing protein [Cyclobacteriaceae bacterium]|nr:DUF4386 domain-containing protein [Cyclobacteriaceae bacterium]